ncbi:transcriptional coactivator/pterin dehydratase, partial [Xylariaceae sp. FL1019]
MQSSQLIDLGTSARAMAESQLKLQVSEGENVESIESEVVFLLNAGWSLDEENMGLKGSFTFTSFAKAADFLHTLFVQSKIRDHHAEIYNMHKLVKLHWTTHRPRGISAKDTQMAMWCHEQALLLGGKYVTEA